MFLRMKFRFPSQSLFSEQEKKREESGWSKKHSKDRLSHLPCFSNAGT